MRRFFWLVVRYSLLISYTEVAYAFKICICIVDLKDAINNMLITGELDG